MNGNKTTPENEDEVSLENNNKWSILKGICSKFIDYEKQHIKEELDKLTHYVALHTGGKKMKIEHNTKDNILIITMEGDCLDLDEVSDFKKQVEGLILNNNQPEVIIDLNNLEHIDSKGLQSLLDFQREIKSRGGHLKFSCVKKPVKTAFEMVKLNKTLEIFETTEAAIHSFK